MNKEAFARKHGEPYKYASRETEFDKDDVLYNVECELNFTYHYGENDYDDGLNCVHYDIVTNSITKFRTSSSSQEYSRRLDSKFEVSVTHERYCTKFECWCHGRDDNDEYDIP